jgi:hypothetical protein
MRDNGNNANNHARDDNGPLDAVSLCAKSTTDQGKVYSAADKVFLDFLGYQGTKEEKARALPARAKADPNYGFNSVLKFFQMKRE